MACCFWTAATLWSGRCCGAGCFEIGRLRAGGIWLFFGAGEFMGMEIQCSRFAVIDFAEDLEALLLQRQPLIGNGPPAPLSAIPAHLVVKLLLVTFDDRRNPVAFVYDDSCFLAVHRAFSFSACFCQNGRLLRIFSAFLRIFRAFWALTEKRRKSRI